MREKALKVAVCDDEKAVCGEIEHMILDYAVCNNRSIDCEVFLSGEDLIRYLEIEESEINLLFLDIELLEINGVETGQYIREKLHNDNMFIVFFSCKESYYRELFSIRPIDFINKPVTKEAISKCIDTTIRLLGKRKDVFNYNVNRIGYSTPIKDILFFTSQGRNVRMVTCTSEINVNMPLLHVYDELRNHYFCMAQKSYLINIAKVKLFKPDIIIMDNDHEIPLGRKYKKEVLKIIKEFKEPCG